MGRGRFPGVSPDGLGPLLETEVWLRPGHVHVRGSQAAALTWQSTHHPRHGAFELWQLEQSFRGNSNRSCADGQRSSFASRLPSFPSVLGFPVWHSHTTMLFTTDGHGCLVNYMVLHFQPRTGSVLASVC